METDGRQARGATFGEAAFRALYPSLRRLAAVVADADVDPDDLVQDALAGFLHQPAGRVDDVEAYLRRSIVNGSAQHRRKAGRRCRILDRQARQDDAVLAAYPAHLRSLLTSVPARDRALLFLLHVEQRPVADVAGILGLSEANVKQRAARARQRARFALIEEEQR